MAISYIASPREVGGYCDAHALWAHLAVRDRLLEFTDGADAGANTDAVGTNGDQSSMECDRRFMRAGNHTTVATRVFGGHDRASVRHEHHRVVAVSVRRTRWDALREFHSREQRVGTLLVGHR